MSKQLDAHGMVQEQGQWQTVINQHVAVDLPPNYNH